MPRDRRGPPGAAPAGRAPPRGRWPDRGPSAGDGAGVPGVDRMKADRPRIDWPEAYARLDRLREALEAGGQPPPEAAQRILEERAQALARRPADVSRPARPREFLVF